MHAQQVHTLLLLVSFFLSLFVVIAAVKYADWAHVMITESGSWLSLILYLGSVPVLSLTYAAICLALLHFDILPLSSVGPLSSPKASISLNAATSLFVMSIIQFVWWLAQAALCTACELGPVLAGHEGRVPKWCPQSRFVDRGVSGLPEMLGNLALVKDAVSWAMVLLTLGLIECARRQWARARLMGREIHVDLAADYETGWKGGISMGGGNQFFEMGNLSKPNRLLPRAPEEFAARAGYVEIGPPPSRQQTVNVNIDPAMSYESRI